MCEAYLKLDPGKWVALAVGALPLALAAQLQAQEPPPYRAAHPAQSGEQAEIDAALRACGLNHLSIVYDPELQMLAAIVRDVQVSDAQLRCAYDLSVEGDYDLQWTEQTRARYWSMASRIGQERAIAKARAYFAARPDLGPVPQRASGQSQIDFARQLERYCGHDMHGFFTQEYGSVIVSSDWLSARLSSADQMFDAPGFECLLNASALTGVPIGFVGNEAASEGPAQ